MAVWIILGLIAVMVWGGFAADSGRYLHAYVCAIVLVIAGVLVLIAEGHSTGGFFIDSIPLLVAYGIWTTASKRYKDEQARLERIWRGETY